MIACTWIGGGWGTPALNGECNKVARYEIVPGEGCECHDMFYCVEHGVVLREALDRGDKVYCDQHSPYPDIAIGGIRSITIDTPTEVL